MDDPLMHTYGADDEQPVRPVGHLHSDGQFCLERAVTQPVWWPVALFAENDLERMRSDDAEIGRRWRENSSLEKWFPMTAELLPRLESDAMRFRWLTDDHADPETRAKCRELLGRMGTMSYSAACTDIDHAMADATRRGMLRTADAVIASREAAA